MMLKRNGFPYSLYLVTDQKACLGRDFLWVVEEALKGGVDLVQIREKELSTADFIEKGKRLKALCDRYEVPLIVNDNMEVAKAIAADGLHVGQSDSSIKSVKYRLGMDFPVGLSLDRMEDLDKPDVPDAAYLGVSPVFSTPTKQDTVSEWGLIGLRELRNKTDKPLVAIGSIKIDNAKLALEYGADCLAVVSGICSAGSPGKAAEMFRNIIESAKNNKSISK